MFFRTNGTKYSRMDRVKFFKGCLPQILLGPFFKWKFTWIAIDPIITLNLTLFKSMFPFYTAWNHQKSKAFLVRSSHRRCSVKNVFLKISQISQEKTGVFLWNLSHRCFPVKFRRTRILKNICERLLVWCF